jgi:hypothetical protein
MTLDNMVGEALRERAAAALDATHAVGERGPRTMRARSVVARWLDMCGRPRGLADAVRWLEHVRVEAD